MELTILGIIVSAIISAIFSDRIVFLIGQILTKIDLPIKADIEGIWIAEFSMKEGNRIKSFKEAIEIKKRLGVIYGYNIPNSINHELLSPIADMNPIRIRASIVDNRFLTGIWYHPNRNSRFHGSFQLIVRTSGSQMEGSWTGYRESKNLIGSGEWIWTKDRKSS